MLHENHEQDFVMKAHQGSSKLSARIGERIVLSVGACLIRADLGLRDIFKKGCERRTCGGVRHSACSLLACRLLVMLTSVSGVSMHLSMIPGSKVLGRILCMDKA